MKRIDSINNPYVKELAKLHQKKYRDETRQFLIEGYHLVEEAHRAKQLKQVLIIDEKDALTDCDNIIVSRPIIERLSSTETPQNILGVCNYFPERDITGNRFLLLDDIQDPGNLGTLVRSCLGFGIDMVILSENSVDLYNDKFVRSTQGTAFGIPIVKRNLRDAIILLKSLQIPVLGTSLLNGIPLKQLAKYDQYALILGNEGNGISQEVLELTDINIRIETSPKLESLNVSVAGSIIMYYLSI